MKKILCFSLAILILTISIFIYCPFYVCADTDKTVLSKSSDSPFGYSSSEAQNYVSAHLDIYDSDNNLLFSYTPTSTYNWTYSAKGKDNLHLSDNQLKAFLMSKKTLSAYAQLMLSGFSNNNVTRGFLSALGIATTGNSNALTDVSDKLLGNYNYINSINYDEDTQTITMDNISVDKLREEIKKYYYISNGMFYFSSNTTNINDVVSTSRYDDMILYQEDYNLAINYDYILYNNSFMVGFNSSDIGYFYYVGKNITSNYYHPLYSLQAVDDDLNPISLPIYSNFNLTDDFFASLNASISSDTYITLGLDSLGNSNGSNIKDFFNTKGYWYSYGIRFDNLLRNGSSSSLVQSWEDGQLKLYSKKNVTTYAFTSYEKLFNYIHGDSSAYLGSAINKVGEDITFSIKDMNENLGSKMDELINSINSGKGNMSADELQNAIDKGLEDLNKNTEDIKDNTSDILGVLKEQNQILLDILGVTTNIYKVVKESDSKEKTYNINYVQSVFNSMFKGLKNAILYGENTVRDDVSEDTDDIDSIVSDIPPDKKNYHNGLFGHFPFSVPYQLFDWLQVLYVEPVAPKFSFSYAYLFEGFNVDTSNFEVVIDLGGEKYAKWFELVRSGEKLSFIIYMAIATYHRFKNEV